MSFVLVIKFKINEQNYFHVYLSEGHVQSVMIRCSPNVISTVSLKMAHSKIYGTQSEKTRLRCLQTTKVQTSAFIYLFFLKVSYLNLLHTGLLSAVSNLSGYRCVSDASSIPARSHTLVEIDHEIISTVILPPSTKSFKKGCLSVTSESMCTNYWLTACSSLPRKKCG